MQGCHRSIFEKSTESFCWLYSFCFVTNQHTHTQFSLMNWRVYLHAESVGRLFCNHFSPGSFEYFSASGGNSQSENSFVWSARAKKSQSSTNCCCCLTASNPIWSWHFSSGVSSAGKLCKYYSLRAAVVVDCQLAIHESSKLMKSCFFF